MMWHCCNNGAFAQCHRCATPCRCTVEVRCGGWWQKRAMCTWTRARGFRRPTGGGMSFVRVSFLNKCHHKNRRGEGEKLKKNTTKTKIKFWKFLKKSICVCFF